MPVYKLKEALMKKTKINPLAGTLAAFLLLALVTGCANPPDNETDDNAVDFTSHITNYSILIRNNTGERLVAFKGELRENNIIGGIPARAVSHALPKDPALFNKSEMFAMVLLTEGQFNAHRNDLNALSNTPFVRLLVSYSHYGDNTAVYEISEFIGGNNRLIVLNTSASFGVELRASGIAGEIIGYAPAGILETTLRLQDGNYNIFPVFIRYNAARDVVETVYLQGAGSGTAWSASFSLGAGMTSATMNLEALLQSPAFVSRVAWVQVDNQTGGGIRFVDGSYVHATASGLTYIMPGNPRTFQIDMPMAGNNYADSITVSNWKFGASGSEVALQTGENDAAPLGPLTVERGKMYTITVSGSHGDNSLKAWVSDTTDIPW